MSDAILEAANKRLRDAVAERTGYGGGPSRTVHVVGPDSGPTAWSTSSVEQWTESMRREWDAMPHAATLQPMELRTQEQPPRFVLVYDGALMWKWIAVSLIAGFYETEPGFEGWDDGFRTHIRCTDSTRWWVKDTPEAFAARLNGQEPQGSEAKRGTERQPTHPPHLGSSAGG